MKKIICFLLCMVMAFRLSYTKITSINEIDAIKLLNIYHITPVRDEDSGSMVFRYTDKVNLAHEVWYADEETIDLCELIY